MKKPLAALLTIGLLLCSACGPAVSETPPPPTASVTVEPTLPPLLNDEEALAALLDEVNAKNEALNADVAGLDDYRYDFSNGQPLLSAEELAQMTQGDETTEIPKTITQAQAREDVEYLFRLLRTRYGLYTFFGGDEVFDAAKEALLEQLAEDGEEIEVATTYQVRLNNALSFIKDNHFIIGSQRFGGKTTLLGDEKRPFSRRDGAYYGGKGGEQRVESIDGAAPETYLKRAIGTDGALVWCVYLRTEERLGRKTVTVRYTDGTEEAVNLFKALAHPSTDPWPKEDCVVTKENGVYTAQINAMVFADSESGPVGSQNTAVKEQILNTAKELRDYPAAVFDLRYNGGGNGNLPDEWFAAYTGREHQSNCATLRIRGESTKARDEKFASIGMLVDGDYYVSRPGPQFVDPEGPLLIVRTGAGTASAAEGFTDMTRNLKNALVVGAPTGGTLQGNMAYSGGTLPHSKLAMCYGDALYDWPEGYFAEGRGLEPDLYLTGSNVDERLALFLERYLPYYENQA